MALSKERKRIRDAKIMRRYDVLSSILTAGGKRKMSYEAIVEELSNEFCLSEYTVWQIIKSHT